MPEALSLDDDRYALFFDIDGTLLDLAASPDAVSVDPVLADALAKLGERLSGAVALVTGRPLEFVEGRFPLFAGAVAALHGTEFRLPSGEVERIEPDEPFRQAKNFIQYVTEQIDGFLVEDKGNAIALHYRAAQDKRDIAREAIEAAAKRAGPQWCVQAGKLVFELRSRDGDKGTALRRLMQHTPFAGRLPLAFGDDLTDVPMLEAARALGGMGFAIGDAIGKPSIIHTISTPAVLRAWVVKVAEG